MKKLCLASVMVVLHHYRNDLSRANKAPTAILEEFDYLFVSNSKNSLAKIDHAMINRIKNHERDLPNYFVEEVRKNIRQHEIAGTLSDYSNEISHWFKNSSGSNFHLDPSRKEELIMALKLIIADDASISPIDIIGSPGYPEAYQKQEILTAKIANVADFLTNVLIYMFCYTTNEQSGFPNVDRVLDAKFFADIKADIDMKNASFNFMHQLPRLQQQISMSNKDTSDLLELLFTQGFSGRMGRHTLRQLAENGNTQAEYELAELYYHRYIKCSGNNFKQAAYWYERAAAKQHPGATWNLGYMILNGIYPDLPEEQRDYRLAKEYFDRCLKVCGIQGTYYGAVLTSVGQMWEDGWYPKKNGKDGYEPKDKKKALELYIQASEQGYHYATNRVALRYLNDGKIDDSIAWFKKSIAQITDGYALYKLGWVLEKHKSDSKSAALYYLRSIQEPFEDDITPPCYCHAGRAYAALVDRSWEPDYTKAFDCFIRSWNGHEHSKSAVFAFAELIEEMINCLLEYLRTQRDQKSSIYTRMYNDLRYYFPLYQDKMTAALTAAKDDSEKKEELLKRQTEVDGAYQGLNAYIQSLQATSY